MQRARTKEAIPSTINERKIGWKIEVGSSQCGCRRRRAEDREWRTEDGGWRTEGIDDEGCP